MVASLEFIHFMALSYHCSYCKKVFIYKKNITKRNKEEREKNFEKTGTLCNDIECSYCREHGIKCERSFSRTQKEFEKFKTKVNHINWQFKPTKIK
ncbi:5041_t:CDS:2, partial [Gigaspora rosea]